VVKKDQICSIVYKVFRVLIAVLKLGITVGQLGD